MACDDIDLRHGRERTGTASVTWRAGSGPARADASDGVLPGRAIALHARTRDAFPSLYAHTLALLQRGAAEHPGRIVQATSLGAEDMVITDLIARHRLDIAVGTLQTGMLHAETLALIPLIEARLGIRVEIWEPRPESVAGFVAANGARAMYASTALRKTCCAIRKLEPLARMLAGRDAWITGLRREQSDGRRNVPFSDTDDSGRTKLNPLADWTLGDVWHYIDVFDVPYNPLHDRFYPSIGCEPCTRAVAVGEDPRAGRWWWEDDGVRECGLHTQPGAAVSASPRKESR